MRTFIMNTRNRIVCMYIIFSRNQEMCSVNGIDNHLLKRDTAGQEFDEISGSDDNIRVKCFLSGTNSHAAFNQVQRSFDILKGSIYSILEMTIFHSNANFTTVMIIPNGLTTSPKAFSTSGQHSFR